LALPFATSFLPVGDLVVEQHRRGYRALLWKPVCDAGVGPILFHSVAPTRIEAATFDDPAAGG
jgi:hypothetical protein